MAVPENVQISSLSNIDLDSTLQNRPRATTDSKTGPVTIEYNSQEELLQQHRKERKEFQGKVQSIRKLVAKADKKRKKEAAEQIAELELELEKKQNEELHQLEIRNLSKKIENIDETNGEIAAESKQSQQRITKAQRRRDKKNVKSKERTLEIEAQELENIHGARNVETQKIKQILKDRNLMIHEIPSDGNCLYCAIDHQWRLINEEELRLETLRKKTSDYLHVNKSDFLPFITHPETDDLLTDEQYEEYCSKVANTSAWGGEVELRALSHILKCSIEVIQANGPSIIIGKEYQGRHSVMLTYHRHMYSLGEHYNSVKPYQELQEEEVQPCTP